jgi:hypothetical protein
MLAKSMEAWMPAMPAPMTRTASLLFISIF